MNSKQRCVNERNSCVKLKICVWYACGATAETGLNFSLHAMRHSVIKRAALAVRVVAEIASPRLLPFTVNSRMRAYCTPLMHADLIGFTCTKYTESVRAGTCSDTSHTRRTRRLACTMYQRKQRTMYAQIAVSGS